MSATTVILLVVATFYLTSQFLVDKVTEQEVARLRAENKELGEKFEQLRWKISEIESRYSDLTEKEITIRSAFDLPEINAQERQLGIGGPLSPAIANMSTSEKAAYASEMEVERLLRLSEFEMKNYAEVESSLTKLKDRLDHTPSIWPTKGWLSRGFGMKYDPFTNYKQMHAGIDIADKAGTKIYAPAGGRVKKVARYKMLGRLVVIDHGYGFQTTYGHLSEAKVKVGQKVKRGDLIALMGSTGYSTGPHLHYQVTRNGKYLDPLQYILNDK
jgi:murein DD-endopeptidase MepM/ murein hydrolase activator NlpD